MRTCLVRLGPIADVFEEAGANLPKINRAPATINLSGQQTAKLDTALGLTLLGTFVTALGGNAGLKTIYKKARFVAFTYEAVMEESIDLTKLDAFLSNAFVREDLHTINQLLQADDVYVFTRVLKTKKLGVEAFASSGNTMELEVPAIQQAVGGQLAVTADNRRSSKLVYEGKVPIAFGFQAVRLLYEEGHFRLKPVAPGTVGARAVGRRKSPQAAVRPEPVIIEAPLVMVEDLPRPMGDVAREEIAPMSLEGIPIAPSEPLSIQPAALSARSLVVPQGAAPDVQTVIYIHGIGNKPVASVLKCQWDRALFGVELGDRSRMAYWVNREYYPVPLDEGCAGQDYVRVDDEEASTKAIMALAGAQPPDEDEALEREIQALTANPAKQQFLRGLSRRILAEVKAPDRPPARGGYGAKVLPLPPFLRRLITRKITRTFLRDVNDFLFREDRRRTMERSLTERLEAGGGPFVVIAHSQGSMVAYNVLRQLTKAQCDVRLFLTIGSPLGLAEVQDVFKQWTGGILDKPACVARWVNVADKLDPVAADSDISNDYRGGVINYDGFFLNPDSPRHPHSGTGYLRSQPVQREIQQSVTAAFTQPIARSVIARDLVAELEDLAPEYKDHGNEDRSPVLIQLTTSDRDGSLVATREMVQKRLESLMQSRGHSLEAAEIDHTQRFIAAKLTRFEIESLRTEYQDLRIERVWRNADKRALLYRSTHTVQAAPANNGYGATGEKIGWAVLDTGIRADHPHFDKYKNVVQQWDCTKRGAPVEVSKEESQRLDGNGHGTHVAAIIAGQCAIPLKANEDPVVFAGMAPRAQLHGFKVLDDQGNGQDSWIIKALDKISELNEAAGRLVIHGVNVSLGGNFDPSVYGCGHTPLCQELRRLWRQGVLVCLAAGNEGYALLQSANGELPSNLDLSIGDPANLEEAISVGSVHKINPHTYGISYFSSRGPTADGRRKPDLVAPGEQILSAYHDWKRSPQVASDLYIEMSGTSMATPHVSGILAAFLSLRREFIGYPERVKEQLLRHCTDLGRDPYIQGCGMPNLIKMLVNS